MSSLVIVESPAKAKTLSRILGEGYTVEASYGHVRDLPRRAEEIPARIKSEPWARLGVNIDDGFKPLYVVSKENKKHIQNLKRALEKADELLLATDEDREGESISWHVLEELKPKVPVRRIVFHEITPEAIREALAHPRDLDSNLVRAQESRRILDRLFGYQLSPLLWRKVRSGLSAGRVQSVAVRLCVLRERERRAFVRAGYWDVEAQFEHSGRSFGARLTHLDGQRIAAGKNFDADTGELKPRSRALWLRSEEEARQAIAAWSYPWEVRSVEEKPVTRRPSPPFTTSTLQQEANRKLRFTARRTMRIAQRLYEGIDVNGDRVGLITYMRTDSLTLSGKALHDAQRLIEERYGEQFTHGPRPYKTKSRMAQEAHEAIRPTEISRTPEKVRRFLNEDEQRLYELIWRRTVASQMSDAKLRKTTVEITAPSEEPAAVGLFATTGTAIEFPGFLRVYFESPDNSKAPLPDQETLLPKLSQGDSLQPLEVEPSGHETTPPARFTEATLVKELEAEGIGRPSTYASIIDTIQDRGYVVKRGNALVPTFTAHIVTKLLEAHFRDYVDTTFTASMELKLDDIAEGHLDWQQHLKAFYYGEGEENPGLESRIANQAPEIDYPSIELGAHPVSKRPIRVKVGKFGPYVQIEDEEGEKVAASIPEDIAPADLTIQTALDLLEKARQGGQLLGHHPDTGDSVNLLHGRFGPYVQLGESPPRGSKQPKPRRASLPKGVAEEEVTLEAALRWLSLPRSLGTDEESGEEVIATTGRFGPFLKRGKDTRSLPAEEDIYEVGLERALEILSQPKKGRARKSSRTVIKNLGKDPEGRDVEILDGRYGPYVTNGELNASLPKGDDPESLTLEAALQLLETKGKPPRGGRPKPRGGKKPPRRS